MLSQEGAWITGMPVDIVALLAAWSHSGAYLITVPLFIVCAIMAGRVRADLGHATRHSAPASVRLRGKRALALCIAAMCVLSLAFVVGFGHLGCGIRKSRSMSCLSNEKQLAAGLLRYAHDNDETFPPSRRWAEIPQLRKADSAFRCPAAHSAFGYGMNRSVGGLRLERIADMAATVLLFEADTQVRSFAGGLEDVAATRHTLGSNLAFCDGHTRWSQDRALREQRWTPTKPNEASAAGPR
jgi:prepilin-type processing-associated H-X9-DG protein